jgi:hypothetical protein
LHRRQDDLIDGQPVLASLNAKPLNASGRKIDVRTETDVVPIWNAASPCAVTLFVN